MFADPQSLASIPGLHVPVLSLFPPPHVTVHVVHSVQQPYSASVVVVDALQHKERRTWSHKQAIYRQNNKYGVNLPTEQSSVEDIMCGKIDTI